MISVNPSPTADTRACDYANTSKKTLLDSSIDHIRDVRQAMTLFAGMLASAANHHDQDKLTDIDGFHADFVTGFERTAWWDRHRMLNRHHLETEDGIPENVNLIDVLDHIADGVMAGMARSGSVRPFTMTPALLERAFLNTVEFLRSQVVLVEAGPPSPLTTGARQTGETLTTSGWSNGHRDADEQERV